MEDGEEGWRLLKVVADLQGKLTDLDVQRDAEKAEKLLKEEKMEKKVAELEQMVAELKGKKVDDNADLPDKLEQMVGELKKGEEVDDSAEIYKVMLMHSTRGPCSYQHATVYFFNILILYTDMQIRVVKVKDQGRLEDFGKPKTCVKGPKHGKWATIPNEGPETMMLQFNVNYHKTEQTDVHTHYYTRFSYVALDGTSYRSNMFVFTGYGHAGGPVQAKFAHFLTVLNG